MAEERIQTIESFRRTLLPFEIVKESEIANYTEKSPANYLNRFYLFPITELTISNEVEDIAKFINERYLNVLFASYKVGLHIMTAIIGKKGKAEVYIGFLSEEDESQYIFQKIVEGALPGVNACQSKNSLCELVYGKKYGGIISGIPTVKIDDEKQRFKLSSVVRSMYGENYALLIISRPVKQSDLVNKYQILLQIRDECHSLAKRTVGKEKGEEKSKSTSISKSESLSEGYTDSGNLLLVGGSSTRTKTETKTKGESSGISKHRSESLSYEQQYGVALELEKIAENFIERFKKGMNVGFWETTITFATETEAGSKILAGSFIGELSRPNPEILPPIKVRFTQLDDEQIFPIPSETPTSKIFPKNLCSYITSEELSLISAPPTESLPGYEIKKMPTLSLTDTASLDKEGEFVLGHIVDYGRELEVSTFTLTHSDLVKHTFVCGITGSGKTTTVKQILKQAQVPFLVLESAKRDYRQLYGDETFKDKIRIYTIGDANVSPIRLNPFYVMEGVSPLSHIDLLKAIFNASFSLYGPMPHILEKCLHNIYIKRGWNLTTGTHPFFHTEKGEPLETRYKYPEHYYFFPTLDDLKNEVDSYIKTKLEYKGELSDNIRTAIVVRLESLGVGAKGIMFNTHEFLDMEELLKYPTVFEMEPLSDDDDKAFFVGLMLTFISEFRQIKNPTRNIYDDVDVKVLQHLLVIEEAHRLLKNIETERVSELMGNPKGKAVETFCNIISEMRSLGEGVIIVEQIPLKITPDVIKNTNTKIVHRLVSKDDQLVLAGSLSIDEDDALYLNRLKTGFALCHKEGMERPIEVKISSDVKDIKITDEKIKKEMEMRIRKYEQCHLELNEFTSVVGKEGEIIVLKLLNSLLTSSSDKVSALLTKAQEELNKITIQKKYRNYFHPDTLKYFIIHQIMKYLTFGVYCKEWKCPDGITKVLTSVIEKENSEDLAQLKSILTSYWDNKDIKEVVCCEIIPQLMIKYFDKEIEDFELKKLKKLIYDYFLIPDMHISECNKILKEIMRKKEVN